MNNPFSRFKHYLRDEIDPQENHATECLAACLVFSSKIATAFIQFLYANKTQIEIQSSAEIEIITQQQTDSGGYIDLVLRQQGKFVCAVEVKVKASENDANNHHRMQLQDYRRWVNCENKTNGYLFTLVRNPDKNFCPEQYGANGRRCWRDLYNHFQTISRGNNLSDVEVSLITNFCNYLESEGIVSTYEPKDLLNYAVGIKARKAVTGILYQVGSRLEKENYKIALTDEKKDSWPQLKIQHSDWQKKFGKGENWKISLWFTVPEIWEAKKHDFYFEIELWHEAHQNEWSYMKSRLPKWFEILKSENFSWSVFQKNWNSSRDNISASEIPAEPKRICVWKTHSEAILNQDGSQDEAEVISLLVEQVKKYAAVIDALK